MENKIRRRVVNVPEEVIQTGCIKTAAPANKAVNLIVLSNEEFGEVTPILARDAGHEGALSQTEKPAASLAGCEPRPEGSRSYTRAGTGISLIIPARKALASPNSISVLSM